MFLQTEIKMNEVRDSSIRRKNYAQNGIAIGFNESDYKKIDNTLDVIKKTWKIDYTLKPKLIKEEEKKLTQLLLNYIENNLDDFNSYYLKLYAFYLSEFKLFAKKRDEKKLSLFECSDRKSINHILKLFWKHRKENRFFLDGLVISYLNNYSDASRKFQKFFLRYLKKVRYSKNVIYYFKPSELHLKLQEVPQKNFVEKALAFGIKRALLNTQYFIDLKKGFDKQ